MERDSFQNRVELETRQPLDRIGALLHGHGRWLALTEREVFVASDKPEDAEFDTRPYGSRNITRSGIREDITEVAVSGLGKLKHNSTRQTYHIDGKPYHVHHNKTDACSN